MIAAGRAVLAAGFAATALAGCGGGPLSLHDLRSEATSVCQSADTRAAGIATPTQPAGAAAFLAAGAAVLQPQLTKLRALDPPTAQATRYRSAIGAVAEELQLVRQTQSAVAHTDPATAVAGLQRALAPVRSRGDAAWQSLGIPACVSR